MPPHIRRAIRHGAIAVAALAATIHLAAPAAAHPHVFIAARLTVVADASGQIAALDVDWTFDDIYSAYVTADLPKDKAGKPSAEALATLARQILVSLAEWRYFTEIVRLETGGIADNQNFGTPGEPVVRLDARGLAIAFRLPLAAPLLPDGQRLLIRQYDPSFYVAIETVNDGVGLAAPLAAACKAEIAEPKPPQTAHNLSEGSFQLQGATGGIGTMFASNVTIACR
ncbi:MAG: DUF1007 family protein [Alphaproteobacteria bacterium]|nr:DUF1007 family protein [Alphaproteobacteria bacterium]